MEVYFENQDKILYADLVVFLGLILILVFTFYRPYYENSLGGISSIDIYRASILSIFLGISVFLIIVFSVGGLSDLLSMAELLRSGDKEISTGILFHFAKLLLPASLVLYSTILEGKRKVVLFLLSFIFSMLLLASLAGRAIIVIYISSFIYLKFIKNGKIYIKYSFTFIVISVFFILYGDYLFNILYGGAGVGVKTKILLEGGAYILVQDILREFTFPYVNLLFAIEDVSGIFSFYPLEVAKGVFNLLPLGTLGLSNVDTLSNVNTIKYGTEGQIPVDLLSFGYYSMGVIGVLVFVSIICVIYKSFDEQMYSSSSYAHYSLHSVVACKLCFVVMYSDMEQFITGNFYIIIFMFICFMFKEARRS
ncbi:O-antigen polymerase [Salinibacter ruber]|uniref:O-antigen polymerase n=1 Tax=Salinibacter ruber TaxID=146919 RepID=UPI0013C2CAD5|nr:O-antigen polymerase [Salinibacter ruber]